MSIGNAYSETVVLLQRRVPEKQRYYTLKTILAVVIKLGSIERVGDGQFLRSEKSETINSTLKSASITI